MIICYYTENGKISSCHEGGNYTYVELSKMCDEYNSSQSSDKKCYVTEVPDDSLTAYLMRAVTEKKTYSDENYQEIRNTLYELDDMIASLFRGSE